MGPEAGHREPVPRHDRPAAGEQHDARVPHAPAAQGPVRSPALTDNRDLEFRAELVLRGIALSSRTAMKQRGLAAHQPPGGERKLRCSRPPRPVESSYLFGRTAKYLRSTGPRCAKRSPRRLEA